MNVQITITATKQSEYPISTLVSDIRELLETLDHIKCPVDGLPFTKLESEFGVVITLTRLPESGTPVEDTVPSKYKDSYKGVGLLQATNAVENPKMWHMCLEYGNQACTISIETMPDMQPTVEETLRYALSGDQAMLHHLLGLDYGWFRNALGVNA